MVQVIAGFYMCSLLQGKGELGFEPGSLDDWNGSQRVRSEEQQEKKSVKLTRKKNFKILVERISFWFKCQQNIFVNI